MRYGVLQFLKGLGALLAALLVSFSVYLIHASSFTGGESTYYLYSASSQAQIKQALSLADLAHLKGESAVYVFEKERAENAAARPSTNMRRWKKRSPKRVQAPSLLQRILSPLTMQSSVSRKKSAAPSLFIAIRRD